MTEKKKKPDMVVTNPSIMEYPTNIGAPSFTIPDVLSKQRERGVNATNQLETKFDEIKERYFELVRLAEDTELVYNSKYSFVPVIGQVYHLYIIDETYVLSLIEPSRWDKEHCGSFKYTSENTWERI